MFSKLVTSNSKRNIYPNNFSFFSVSTEKYKTVVSINYKALILEFCLVKVFNHVCRYFSRVFRINQS